MMGSVPNTTPRRQSCDRCHSQKLRCSRADNSRTGACDRCVRKGTPCSYSSSLPKGRPALYRLNETPAENKEFRSATPMQREKNQDQDQSGTTSGAQAVTLDTDADFNNNTEADSDMDVDISVTPDAFVLQGSMDMFMDVQGSWRWTEGLMGWDSRDLDSAIDVNSTMKTQLPAGSELSSHSPFPSLSSTTSTRNSGSTGQLQSRPAKRRLEIDVDESRSMVSSSSSSSSSAANADKDGFKLSIAHLSRLCTRLSQLLRSRCSPGQALDQSLDHGYIETIFKSVNSWLDHEPANTNCNPSPDRSPGSACETKTTGDLLQHAFSASNHLMEILRYSQNSGTGSTLGPSTACPSLPPSSNNSSSTNSLNDPSLITQQSCTVMHNLVLTCVNLLLNIYSSILISLQRSADALSSSLLTKYVVEPRDHIDATMRGHIQLVSVVQLCSYFIKRQNRTLDMILLNQLGEGILSWQEQDTQQKVFPDMSWKPALEEMGHLKTEVEQRLRRLQESLSIFT